MNKHTMPANDEVKIKNLPQDSLDRGQALYEAHCLACHGKNGRGNGPKAAELDEKPKDLAKLAKNVPEFKFYMMVSMLQGDMPGWKTIFTSQEIIDLENYLKTL
jgi:mono/diheme cytochrome c family protein